jgi:hypothetical protein
VRFGRKSACSSQTTLREISNDALQMESEVILVLPPAVLERKWNLSGTRDFQFFCQFCEVFLE